MEIKGSSETVVSMPLIDEETQNIEAQQQIRPNLTIIKPIDKKPVTNTITKVLVSPKAEVKKKYLIFLNSFTITIFILAIRTRAFGFRHNIYSTRWNR